MENRHLQRRFPNLKYMQMRWRQLLRPGPGELTALPYPLAGFGGKGKGD